MNRIIKFRGQRTDTKEWVYGYYFRNIHGNIFIINITSIKNGLSLWVKETEFFLGGMIEVIPETVGQYTGKKDKNDKEIYEKDIIQTDKSEGWADPKPNIVKWDKEQAGFYPFINKLDEMYTGEFEKEVIKVIGNIYKNPELLK